MRQCEFEQYEPSQIDTKKTILEQLLVMKSMMKNNFPTQQIFVADKRITQNMTTEDLTNINGRKVKVNDLIVFYNTNILEWGIVESIEENNLVIKDIGQINSGGNGDINFNEVNTIRFISDIALEATPDGITYSGTAQVEMQDGGIQSFQFEMEIPVIGSENIVVDLDENNDKIQIRVSGFALGTHYIQINGTGTQSATAKISLLTDLFEKTPSTLQPIDNYTKLKNKLSSYEVGTKIKATGFVIDNNDNHGIITQIYYDNNSGRIIFGAVSSVNGILNEKFYFLDSFSGTYTDNIIQYTVGD